MNCPVCKNSLLTQTTLEVELPAYACEQCHGNWISAREYWRWLERHGPSLPEKAPEGPEVDAVDTVQVKVCPECRLMMLRYQVGHGTGIGLDQCGGCGGIWFDRGEWELLKNRNLHDEVHAVFTVPWQSAVRREASRERLEEIRRQRFGVDYEEIKRIRSWIEAHAARDQIIAFFTDPDPYQP
jgi:Zn-finger nucleic acid-binding protein